MRQELGIHRQSGEDVIHFVRHCYRRLGNPRQPFGLKTTLLELTLQGDVLDLADKIDRLTSGAVHC